MTTILFAVLVILFFFFVACGIQFGRGKWLGLIIKQKPVAEKKHPSKKQGNEKKEARAKRRQEEARLAVGAQLSYVMFAAAFASFIQIVSQILLELNVQPLGTVFFFITLLCYIAVFVLLVRTIRKIQGK